MSASPLTRRFGPVTAAALVVASMVGTGVFTTTGFLVRDLGSNPAILLCWVLGGVTALAGALAYAELTTIMPGNGGEYLILSRVYHPALGFVAGWTGAIVGFAAPIAAAAIAFSKYLGAVFPGLPTGGAGVALLVGVTVIHVVHVKAGGRFQDVFTIGKGLLIVVFIVAGLIAVETSHLADPPTQSMIDATLTSKFAAGLIYVAFAYSGWNAAAYIAGEVEDPARNLPRALFAGAAIVTVLYVALNVVFLSAAPAEALAGKVEVAHVASVHLFGEAAARVLSAIIALGLVSTVGAMVLTGARIYEAMGTDYPKLAWLARRSKVGGPVNALSVQCVLAIAMIGTASFDQLLSYTGFTLTIGTALGVGGVVVYRRRAPDVPRPYKTWGYPVMPLMYVALALWMTIGMLYEQPIIALSGLATVAAGLVVYVVVGGSQSSIS